MEYDFLKPPRWSTWLLTIVGAVGLASVLSGWPTPGVTRWLFLAGTFLGGWPIAYWLGRVIGFLARDMAEQAVIGWREGVERSQRERAEQQARQRR